MNKKNNIPCPSEIYSSYANLVKYLKIKQCNPPYNRLKGKYHVIISDSAEKIFDKIHYNS